MTKLLFIGCAGMALAGFMAPRAEAGKPRPRRVEEYKQAYDQIVAIDLAAQTVRIATMVREMGENGRPAEYVESRDHKKHTAESAHEAAAHQQSVVTLKVTGLTEIQVNGQKGDMHSLSKGMKVDVTKGLDDTTAARLVATTAIN